MLIESKIISSVCWMADQPKTRPVGTCTGRHRKDNRTRGRLQNVQDRTSVVLLTRWNRI